LQLGFGRFREMALVNVTWSAGQPVSWSGSSKHNSWRRVALTAVLIWLILVLLGCGGQSSDQGPAAEGEPSVLTLGTFGVGSIVNAMGAGIATVLSQHLGVEVKVVASSGPTEWLPMIHTGEMDLGLLNSWDAQMGREGKSSYERLSGGQGFPIMLITSGHKALTGVVVPNDLGIRQGADIKGKRFVGAYSGSPAVTAIAHAALANWGLSFEDVAMVTMPSVEQGVRALIEGRAEVNGTSAVGMGFIAELEASRGARFLSFDPSPDAAKRLQEKFPARLVKVTPGPGKTGVREEIYLMSYDFYLVGRESLAENLVYDIVKILWEQNQALTRINHPLQDWTPENFIADPNTIPYHPGSIRLYKEMNVWPSAGTGEKQSSGVTGAAQ